MLTGLCRSHSKTQLAIVPVIPQVHLLEQVASDQHIGTMAENLLEAMMENPTCQAEVSRCTHMENIIMILRSWKAFVMKIVLKNCVIIKFFSYDMITAISQSHFISLSLSLLPLCLSPLSLISLSVSLYVD